MMGEANGFPTMGTGTAQKAELSSLKKEVKQINNPITPEEFINFYKTKNQLNSLQGVGTLGTTRHPYTMTNLSLST